MSAFVFFRAVLLSAFFGIPAASMAAVAVSTARPDFEERRDELLELRRRERQRIGDRSDLA